MGCGSSLNRPERTTASSPKPQAAAKPPDKAGFRLVWVADGAGQWVHVSRQGEASVLLQSASGLRDADVVGLSDPYAVIRLGPAGSAWDDKTDTPFGERRSTVEANTLDPVWQCAFSLGSPPSDDGWAASGWELHCRVYDQDYASFDDALGEVRLPLSTLLSHPDTLRDYTLSQQGSVRLMMGDRVATALEEAAQAEVEHASGVAQILTAAWRLGQYMEAAFATYNATMLSFLFAIKTCLRLVVGVDGQPPALVDGLTAWLDRRTAGTGRWAGPLEPANSTTYTSHAEVSARLAGLGQRLGRSDGDGEAARGNWLGFQRLNSRCWPEVPWRGIGLGAPQEAHGWIRPIICELCGPQGQWSAAKVDEAAAAFFAPPGGAARTEFRAVRDLKVWVCKVCCSSSAIYIPLPPPHSTPHHTPHHTTHHTPHCTLQVLHEILFGAAISEARASELVALQWTWMKCMAAPDGALDVPALRKMLGLDAFLPAKATLTLTLTITLTLTLTLTPTSTLTLTLTRTLTLTLTLTPTLTLTLPAKAKLLGELEPLVRSRVPAAAQRSDADVTALTSCLLDALMFAGGQSIPSVLAYALALPYSETCAAGTHGPRTAWALRVAGWRPPLLGRGFPRSILWLWHGAAARLEALSDAQGTASGAPPHRSSASWRAVPFVCMLDQQARRRAAQRLHARPDRATAAVRVRGHSPLRARVRLRVRRALRRQRPAAHGDALAAQRAERPRGVGRQRQQLPPPPDGGVRRQERRVC